MKRVALAVPTVVRNKAIAHGAQAWLDGLANLVADLAHEWSLTIGRIYDGGTEAFVVDATLADGTPAVLKLLIPRAGDAARNEITVLRLTDGEGCAQLWRDDVDRGAMLLDRLGPSLPDLGLSMPERHEILCSAAQRIWRPAHDCGLPSGAEKGRWLIEQIVTMWEDLDHPCSERAVEHAVECAETRIAAHDDERAVLVHGDVHEWNALATAAGAHHSVNGYKLVDPDGLLADAEYDMGILMREDPDDLLAGGDRDRAAWLASRTGLDAITIWEWGNVERVSTGLLCVQVELQPIGTTMLAVADRIARER